MEAYSEFAGVYDLFMDNVPYEAWRDYIVEILKRHNITDGIVLDLGCGTGKMTRLLAQAGYDMIGVDASEEMLAVAMEHKSLDPSILYLNQDMRAFELYGTVKAVISVCDSINYITKEEDLLAVFRLVNNYLDPGGIFLFDLNTLYKYREILGETTICENRQEGSFIWENYYDEEEQINEYDMTFFIREEDGRYRRYKETHYQRGYSIETVQTLLEQAGLEFVACYKEQTTLPPEECDERIYMIARECTKHKGA